MRNKGFWYLLSFVIMIVLPFLTVTFVKGDNSMAICFILFYAINPLYHILTGIVAGLHKKDLMLLPLITAILFLIGIIFIFDISEYLFSFYAVIYMLLGYFAIGITLMIKEKKEKK